MATFHAHGCRQVGETVTAEWTHPNGTVYREAYGLRSDGAVLHRIVHTVTPGEPGRYGRKDGKLTFNSAYSIMGKLKTVSHANMVEVLTKRFVNREGWHVVDTRAERSAASSYDACEGSGRPGDPESYSTRRYVKCRSCGRGFRRSGTGLTLPRHKAERTY